MIIKEIKLRDYPYKRRRGLAERLARRHLEKMDYEVFRGRSVLGKEYSLYYDKYENVRRKYDRLERVLRELMGLQLDILREDIRRRNGIPDLFVARQRGMSVEAMFVEVKLEHEQVRPHQLKCMRLLERWGFRCMLLRIKRSVYRKESRVDLEGDLYEKRKLSERRVLVKQEKLWRRYEK